MADEACPIAPELVIEIISPGQTFGEMTQKATDYLSAGVLRVWIVDPPFKKHHRVLSRCSPSHLHRANCPH
ncbi:Uma2 family endonuclease [Leptolyngbya sp. FACHB-261]|uniref:Uma2 family endonuclease n=1 Tax=Leptolyngbya sp. FACHB-261 TaxID=2692806 RepID=UPI00241146EF|nr:Uma2 family endonuclease [Leptolyngbya sp. FACHB-261]